MRCIPAIIIPLFNLKCNRAEKKFLKNNTEPNERVNRYIKTYSDYIDIKTHPCYTLYSRKIARLGEDKQHLSPERPGDPGVFHPYTRSDTGMIPLYDVRLAIVIFVNRKAHHGPRISNLLNVWVSEKVSRTTAHISRKKV